MDGLIDLLASLPHAPMVILASIVGFGWGYRTGRRDEK